MENIDSNQEPNDENVIEIHGSGKRAFVIVGILGAILVTFVWASFASETFFFESEPEITYYDDSQCNGILMEGKAIVLRNGGSDDYNTWENKVDRLKIIELENEFLYGCTVDESAVIFHYLDDCTEILIDWHTFVDKLPSKDKATWNAQVNELDANFRNLYEEKYCGIIQDDLEFTTEYEEHIEEYHEGVSP